MDQEANRGKGSIPSEGCVWTHTGEGKTVGAGSAALALNARSILIRHRFRDTVWRRIELNDSDRVEALEGQRRGCADRKERIEVSKEMELGRSLVVSPDRRWALYYTLELVQATLWGHAGIRQGLYLHDFANGMDEFVCWDYRVHHPGPEIMQETVWIEPVSEVRKGMECMSPFPE